MVRERLFKERRRRRRPRPWIFPEYSDEGITQAHLVRKRSKLESVSGFQRSDLGGPPAFEDLCVQRAREDLLRPLFLHYTPMRLREAALLQ